MPFSPTAGASNVSCRPANVVEHHSDVYVTDPPYGDAINYDEILEFLIAWLRKNPLPEFADWVWDSRRALAIKGDGEDFRRGMVAAYKRMTGCMPDNGLQVIMFTHQDGGVWADMTNIVWAAGLQVTAAWYIATETSSELKKGGYVQGTVLLVLRKRQGNESAYKDELVDAVRREVQRQNRDIDRPQSNTKSQATRRKCVRRRRSTNGGVCRCFARHNLLCAHRRRRHDERGSRPRNKGEKTLVDKIIHLAVQIANECLVPEGLEAKVWEKLKNAERF